MRLISSTQSGVSLGALRAAKKLDIPTAGYYIAGKEERGKTNPNIALAKEFNLKPSINLYDEYIGMNVKIADAVIRIYPKLSQDLRKAEDFARMRGVNFKSIVLQKIPKDTYSDFPYYVPGYMRDQLAHFMGRFIDSSIYISGATEKVCPGIEEWAENFVSSMIQRVLGNSAKKISEDLMADWAGDVGGEVEDSNQLLLHPRKLKGKSPEVNEFEALQKARQTYDPTT